MSSTPASEGPAHPSDPSAQTRPQQYGPANTEQQMEFVPPPFPKAPQAPRANRVGLAALICGVAACIPFWTGPLVWVFILCALGAVGLGVAGLLVKDRGRRAAVVGIILGVVAVPLQFVWILLTAVITGAM